jgi:threonine dehydratase
MESLAPCGPTLAEGLEGGISTPGFLRVAGVVQGVTVLSERLIARSMRDAWERYGVRLEGSAAVGLALASSPNTRVPTLPGDTVIVLTGRNVDDETHQRVVAGWGPC